MRPREDRPHIGPSALAIEGDEATARLLLRSLTVAGFEVTLAPDGRTGWARFAPERFAAVILAAELPDVQGAALLADLIDRAPAMPVLVLSAATDAASKVLAYELGASDYLTKPFDVAELVARLRRRVSPAATSPVPRARHRGWSLQPERRVVDDGRRSVTLSALEWRVLEHLVARDGATCTRDELVAHVWGGATPASANVVDVAIRRLRRKLGDDAIVTVRGAGYRIG